MPTLPKYRFLPWTRRGLVAEAQQVDGGGTLPSRATLPVAITVSNIAPVPVNLKLYGPGDVIGVDPRMIIRVEPRPFTTDFEPNYVAAIEFDLPEFPWMFTPARANAQNRLRPWCVLVVLDKAIVAPPKVKRGAPLPTVVVPAGASMSELPDLSESWAWAHTQVISDATDAATLAGELAAAPHLNASRLVCPRRLEPKRQYMACLVPTFDLGVQRGLGLSPSGAVAAPAWDVNNAVEVTLPLYFHWEFATGPTGDFESLARKLTPLKSQADIGLQRMFVGQPGDGLPQKPPTDEAGYTQMEGALRAPKGIPSQLADIATDLQTGLQQAVNAPAAATGSAGTGTTTAAPREALAPPLYGQWHVNKHMLQPNSLAWLRELNLDPRMRAAAGLGAEVVRANQEEFMQVCWEQVGEVIKANDRLNWGRLALETGRRVYERHYLMLPIDRLVQVTSPLHGGAAIGNSTLREAIKQTSLPDASFDPALRRLTSPQRPWLKSVARRANFAQAGSRSARTALSVSLMARKASADPTEFTPDGLAGAALLDAVNVPPTATQVDLAPLGIQARLTSSSATRMKTLRSQLVNLRPQTAPAIQMRASVPTGGLITEAHLDKIRELRAEVIADARTQPEREAGRLNVHVTSAQFIVRARGVTNAVAFMVNAAPGATAPVGALSIELGGNLVWRPRPTDAGVTIATLGTRMKGTTLQMQQLLLSRLRAGSLDVVLTPGKTPPELDLGDGGIIIRRIALPVIGPAALPTRTLTTTLLPPVRAPIPVQRFGDAFTRMASTTRVNEPVTIGTFAAFNIAAARESLVAAIRPDTVIPRRVRGMLHVEGGGGLDSAGGLKVMPTFDRIMAAPEIDGPMYEYLIKYDRERFLPGIGQIPADSITLLETNPRFIEAFMVGLNYEMNRELLWREFPTDQRGTVMRRFWDWSDGIPDLTLLINQWVSGALGGHVRGEGAGGQIVLLMRGQLVRRYPNLQIYAWRALGTKLKDPPGTDDIRAPVFAGQFDPDVSFAGFALTDVDLNQGDGWFFVLQEQPTEPRFGLDETTNKTPASLTDWSDAAWPHTGAQPGQHLRITGNPLNDKTIGGVVFGRNAGHLGRILLQRPMRAAIHGKQMLV